MKRTCIALALFASTAGAQMLPQPQQFIDRSEIVFPDVLGSYTLAETDYDPALQYAGVTSRWIVQSVPRELRYTVFVYPTGPGSEPEVVASLFDDMLDEMQLMLKHGGYSNLVPGERTRFEIAAPRASLYASVLGDEDGALPADDASESPQTLDAALAVAQPASISIGERQLFRFDHAGVPTRSIAYVFYRQLYAVKVRASTTFDSMDDATFEALADTATSTLVPHIRAENFGTCGVVPRDEDGDFKLPEGASLLTAATLLKSSNCRSAPDPRDTPNQGETRVEIVYPPETWRQREAP